MENTNSGNNKTMIWIAVGCLVVLVCILAVVLFGFGGLMWLGGQTPENASVQVTAPISAKVGEDVEILVTVTNTSDKDMELSSVDFSLNFLNGFTISQVEPPYTETSQYDALGGGETYQTYYFYRPIAPGETLRIVFTAQAVLAGDYSGDVDVCIDSDFNCMTNVPRTVIE
jgi:hypothetical protein